MNSMGSGSAGKGWHQSAPAAAPPPHSASRWTPGRRCPPAPAPAVSSGGGRPPRWRPRRAPHRHKRRPCRPPPPPPPRAPRPPPLLPPASAEAGAGGVRPPSGPGAPRCEEGFSSPAWRRDGLPRSAGCAQGRSGSERSGPAARQPCCNVSLLAARATAGCGTGQMNTCAQAMGPTFIRLLFIPPPPMAGPCPAADRRCRLRRCWRACNRVQQSPRHVRGCQAATSTARAPSSAGNLKECGVLGAKRGARRRRLMQCPLPLSLPSPAMQRPAPAALSHSSPFFSSRSASSRQSGADTRVPQQRRKRSGQPCHYPVSQWQP